MKTPRILISGGKSQLTNYQNALSAAGAAFETCYGVPQNLSHFDGLVLAGGGDVSPSLYGQTDTACRNIDFFRDQSELTLIEAFVRSKSPILCICRGVQILNVALGGTLCQDLPTAARHRGRDDLYHTVNAEMGSAVSDGK